MKKKIIGIFVVTLLIASGVLPVIGIGKESNAEESKSASMEFESIASDKLEMAIDPSDYIVTNNLNVAIDASNSGEITCMNDVFHIYEGLNWKLYVTAYWDPPQERSICLWVDPATLPEGATFDPCHCAIDVVTSTLDWTPYIGQAGTYYITFYVGESCYEPIGYFTVTVIVYPLDLEPQQTFEIYVGQEWHLELTAYWDPPQPSKLICLWVDTSTLPYGATFTPCHCDYGEVTSDLYWTPTVDQVDEYIIIPLVGDTCGYYVFPYPIKVIVLEAAKNWDIYETEVVKDTTIIMDGHVTIHDGGSLTLENVILKMNVLEDGQYHIEVKDGGAMYISNSVITDGDLDDDTTSYDSPGNARFLFWVREQAEFEMTNSELRECGYEYNYPTFDHEGLWISSDNTVITDNTFSNNLAGIVLYESNYNSISDNIFSGNAYGIAADYSHYNTIEGNTFDSNDEVGLLLWGCENNNLLDNEVYRSELLHGISLRYSDDNTVKSCTSCENGGVGIDVRFSNNNIITDNYINDNTYAGIVIGRNSHDNTVTYNSVCDCEPPQSNNPNINRYNTLGPNEKIGIWIWCHIDDPDDGCTRNIAGGNQIIGFETGISIDPGCNDNTIYGNTISSNDIGICVNDAYNINLNGNLIEDSLIDGIYITNGSVARIEYCTISDSHRHGIFSEKNSELLVHYNNIVGNMDYGIWNDDFGQLSLAIIDAQYNWWGNPNGPGGNGPGTGDKINEGIGYDNWLDQPFTPATPTISGPANGKAGENYEYTFLSIAIDPTNPQIIYYYIDWGDGNTDYIGPHPSGTEISIYHSWSNKGAYTVKAKAEDVHGAESDWAILEVSMPKNKDNDVSVNARSLFIQLFQKITRSIHQRLLGDQSLSLFTQLLLQRFFGYLCDTQTSVPLPLYSTIRNLPLEL